MATNISNQAVGSALFREVFNAREDHLGRSVTFSGSKSFAQLSYTIHDNVEKVTILNTSGATLYYTPNGGTAGTGNVGIPSGGTATIYGTPGKMANVRLYLASSGTIGLLQEITLQTSPITTTTTTA